MHEPIGVFGAVGYTGRQVAVELKQRGANLVLAARDPSRLSAMAASIGVDHVSVMDANEPDHVRRFVGDCRVVVNCAGPFGSTAQQIASACVKSRVDYLDIAGEPLVAKSLFEQFGDLASSHDAILLPAIGFFGALPDLLARAAAAEWATADEVLVAYAVDGWKPTRGSIEAMATSSGNRLVRNRGHLQLRAGAPRFREYVFPDPLGMRDVMIDYPAPEVLKIPRHIDIPEIKVLMTASTVRDLRDASSAGRQDISANERASSTYVVIVEIRSGNDVRKVSFSGRDIYGTSAALAAEAAIRLANGDVDTIGPRSAGEVFDPHSMMRAIGAFGSLSAIQSDASNVESHALSL